MLPKGEMEIISHPASPLTPLHNPKGDFVFGVFKTFSAQEESAFDAFKKKCAELSLLDRPAGIGKNDMRDGLNDDATLLRFLHARQLDINGALKQFGDAHTARQTNQTGVFYETIQVKDYEETRTLYPHWLGRRDKRGLPICVFDIGKLNSKTMTAYRHSCSSMQGLKSVNPDIPGAVSTEMLRAFAVFDGLTRFVMPLCSAVTDRPDPDKVVTKTLMIADISGLGMRQLWNLKGYLQDFSRLLALNYPEILDRVLIMGAPSYFSTIWGWVKNWIDPVTVSKLVVLSHDEVLPTMRQYIDIANIPRRFGGELEYEHGAQPLLDPAIKDILTWEPPSHGSLPPGPIKWVDEGNGSRVAVAVGTEGYSARRNRIACLYPRKK